MINVNLLQYTTTNMRFCEINVNWKAVRACGDKN